MSASSTLDLALRLWPPLRDRGAVDDPADLDTLLAAQGLPGAPGEEGGVRHTFACFPPGAAATFALPAGERPRDDADARLLAHLLVTRTLLAAGLAIDRRVLAAQGDASAMTWAVRGEYSASPLALATSLWLIALDPLAASDRPLAIEWSPPYYQDAARWDLEYRLHSHYDIRERALDWVAYASVSSARHPGCSLWTIVEPLLRFGDGRSQIALAQFAEAADAAGEEAPAAAMLERARVAALLRAFLAQGRGAG